MGTSYGNEVTATTLAALPTLTTTTISAVTSTTATSGGNITYEGISAVTARGVCWGTTPNPTIANSKTTDGTGAGTFTSSITGLLPGTAYYVRAYATNGVGTAYGNELTATTTAILPVLTTAVASSLTSNSVTIGGTITTDGGATVTARGVCWSTTQNPTTANSKTINGTGPGTFVSSVTGLLPGTTYYISAYATKSVGTAYGTQVTITTTALAPTLTTTAISAITSTTATSGGNVTSDGGSAVIARGVCWSTSPSPTISNSKTTDGTGSGTYTSNLTSLLPGKTYYVRAYATNGVGTVYGNELTATTTAILPVLTTAAATSLTPNSVTIGGTITTDGGSTVTARGVCWSTTQNPTTANSKTTDGTGPGTFVSSITGLTLGTTYYITAYATNSIGTAYGTQVTITTTALAPTLTTTAISAITTTTATSGGNISSDGGSAVTTRGICWATTQNPTVANSITTDGTGSGIFTSNLTGLTPGTTYYVKAYATNSIGTTYGNQVNVTTTAITPVLTTTATSAVASTTATSGGNITTDGGSAVTARGVCWAVTQNPTIANSKTSDGTGSGSFTSNLTGLLPSTNYYVKAYATNSIGTNYGDQVTVTTSALAPVLTTTAASAITSTTASSGGNITSDGGTSVTARGVCWAITQNPTVANSITTDGTGSGTFTSNLTGLAPGTTYYAKAYATNSIGTTYGNQVTVSTTAVAPVLTTTAISAISSTTASSGGNISSNGGSAVTARGVCWAVTQNPTIANSMTTNGTGSGTFTSSLTGLLPGTTYYVKAYATNSIGTTYGDQISLTTSAIAPVLTTTTASAITSTTASSGGNITSDGGSAVTVRGVCWNTQQYPTVANSRTTESSGSGTFTSNLTGLAPGTTYYVKAYATNSIGTTYGNQVTFTTTVLPIVFNQDLSYGTVSDIDGNVYKTITIGTQTWMAENLKTTKYRNGDPIAYITDASWGALATGAYCWCNNDAANNKAIYGALYNGYAVADNRNIAPTGWHVPTIAEWNTLITYLNRDLAGGKLKEIGNSHWYFNNTDATNNSGFTALPGGSHFSNGFFYWYGTIGYWWSSTESSPGNAWYLTMANTTSYVNTNTDNKSDGFSVRCVRD